MAKGNYTRRDFLGSAGFGAISIITTGSLCSCKSQHPEKTYQNKIKNKKPSHIITLSFDDGFKKSSIRTAEIFERYNLSACINVIATAHLKTYIPPGKYLAAYRKGDFGLWNELKQRGHEIMPHGYKHANKARIPFDQAKALCLQCLEYFRKHLKGFDPKDAVFNMPYNRSTPELEKWLPTQVRAFRTGGDPINPLPNKQQVKLGCKSFGPGNCEEDLEDQIAKLLRRDSGWLIYNAHGLDGQGWGPMRAEYLDKLLERLLNIDSIAVLPVGPALAMA